jgi:hypothetical protein
MADVSPSSLSFKVSLGLIATVKSRVCCPQSIWSETAAMEDAAWITVACQFAEALVNQDFTAAHGMLCPSLRREFSPDSLQQNYAAMVSYGSGQPVVDGYLYTMTDWPSKRPGDVGWVYVSISGEDFAEAVTVIVSKEVDALKISSIEWGRP